MFRKDRQERRGGGMILYINPGSDHWAKFSKKRSGRFGITM